MKIARVLSPTASNSLSRSSFQPWLPKLKVTGVRTANYHGKQPNSRANTTLEERRRESEKDDGEEKAFCGTSCQKSFLVEFSEASTMASAPYNYSYIFKYIIIGKSMQR